MISLKRSVWMFLVVAEHVRPECGRTVANIHIVDVHVSLLLCVCVSLSRMSVCDGLRRARLRGCDSSGSFLPQLENMKFRWRFLPIFSVELRRGQRNTVWTFNDTWMKPTAKERYSSCFRPHKVFLFFLSLSLASWATLSCSLFPCGSLSLCCLSLDVPISNKFRWSRRVRLCFQFSIFKTMESFITIRLTGNCFVSHLRSVYVQLSISSSQLLLPWKTYSIYRRILCGQKSR